MYARHPGPVGCVLLLPVSPAGFEKCPGYIALLVMIIPIHLVVERNPTLLQREK